MPTQTQNQPNTTSAHGNPPLASFSVGVPGLPNPGSGTPSASLSSALQNDTSVTQAGLRHGVGVSAASEMQAGSSAELSQRDPLILAPSLARLPVDLDVSVPIREFRVYHLLSLTAGTIIETRWGSGDDLPLMSGAVQLAWSEFEVVDGRLAVRVTRLA